MAYYNETITFGSTTIYANTIRPYKKPATIKQKLGSNVVEINVIGNTKQDIVLQIDGVVFETSTTSIASAREAIEALDDAEPHSLSDGAHDGNYIIAPGSLTWSDNAEDVNNIYRYSMRLIQKQ